MIRKFVACMVVFVALGAPVAAKGHIDLGLDAGRAYSIVDGAYVPSTVPSVSFLFGPVTISTSTYLNGKRFFEQDTVIEWWSREDTASRFSFFLYASHYKWPTGQSYGGQAGMRFRVR